jgi:uncharacterized protein YoxC
MAESKLKGVSTGKVVSIVVVAALAAIVVFLVIQNLRLKGQVEDGMETAENLTAEIESVEKQVKEFEYALNEKDLDIDKKQAMLNERDSLIQAQDAKIASLLSRNRISQQEAEAMRTKVEYLEHYVKKYQGEIDVLKQELAQKNLEIDSLKTIVSGTQDSLRKTNDKYINASIKAKGASKLIAHTFTLARYKQSGATVPETKFRASQMDRIKICMDIAENSGPKPGEKMVYIQVKDPDGKIVRDDLKSGFFDYDGAKVPYSAMVIMDYQNQGIQVCLDFRQPAGYKYADGQYTVHAFCEKFEIGKTIFTVD